MCKLISVTKGNEEYARFFFAGLWMRPLNRPQSKLARSLAQRREQRKTLCQRCFAQEFDLHALGFGRGIRRLGFHGVSFFPDQCHCHPGRQRAKEHAYQQKDAQQQPDHKGKESLQRIIM